MSTFRENIQIRLAEALHGAFDVASGDIDEICQDARSYTVSQWITRQRLKGVAVGGGAAVVPVLGYLTLPADILTTLRIMHRTAIGITHIRLNHADQETFSHILAVWSGAANLDGSLQKQIAAKLLAKGSTTIGGQLGLKMAITAFTLCTGAIVAKQLGPQVVTKVATKLSAKLTAKATTRWIPLISAVAGAGVNYWVIDGMSQAAQEYADFIKSVSQDL